MALDLTPLLWDWVAVEQGDTYPAANIVDTLSDTTLVSVRLEIHPAGLSTSALLLDSSTGGITLNGTAPGAWNFTINAISAAQTAILAPGHYDYDLITTDSSGVVRTEFTGVWEITQ